MNKKVIVTGGTRGIGAACVRRFYRAGYDTAAVYRQNDAAAEALFRELYRGEGSDRKSVV